MEIFERLESNVRGYCRSFPTVFKRAQGSLLFDENNRQYIDFFSGAGTLNYGHNHPLMKERLIEYLKSDGLVHGLDMYSSAKRHFLEAFESNILKPREMNYKIQFTGPTGTNAVEAALKLARTVKERTNIISFTNGFHGMTLGSVSMTGNATYREATGVPLSNSTFMPYEGYLGDELDELTLLRKFLVDRSSGMDLPAAVIVETIQGEGGVNVASAEWMKGLADICKEFDILLIVDDIQVGCGRTGPFFSFEGMGIEPDFITLSKSLSGFGLPMSIVLMKPELDIWAPGEHTGTFRGNNMAFVTAATALEEFWSDDAFTEETLAKSKMVEQSVEEMRSVIPEAAFDIRGRGLIYGLDFQDPDMAEQVGKKAFERGMIIETSGSEDHVLKILPPLNIEEDLLKEGLGILFHSIAAASGEELQEEAVANFIKDLGENE